jgi:DNA modification methylase
MSLGIVSQDEMDLIIGRMNGILAEKFVYYPFSVLDARSGIWGARKQKWLSLGIESAKGRDSAILLCGTDRYRKGKNKGPHISTFDPVLCEIMYKWFCPPEGNIVDPFCGGSVRGIVASVLGHPYWGVDLRQEQVDENYEQGKKICSAIKGPSDISIFPEWVVGDSREVMKDAPRCDFIFSCPPYGDLESYSEDPRDLSTMKYEDFMHNYDKIIQVCMDKLVDDRFACFVVGNFRDGDRYHNFVADTIDCFERAGGIFYNDCVLLTMYGTAALRANGYFTVSRKVTKVHQNVLVFAKGDPRVATKIMEE